MLLAAAAALAISTVWRATSIGRTGYMGVSATCRRQLLLGYVSLSLASSYVDSSETDKRMAEYSTINNNNTSTFLPSISIHHTLIV